MAESVGPKRVLLDDFTITVSPTAYALSMVQASEVKDIAEELVEAYFEGYDWGPFTTYQYMGFTNIESVSFYDQSYSVIRVKGGIVSFEGSSESIPSHVEIQNMIQEQLDPTGGGGKGLTQVLQATQDFAYVEETIYEVLWEPTLAPSLQAPPTPSPITAKTTTPAPSPGLVYVPVDDSPSENDSSGAGALLPAIAGIAAGLILLAGAAVLLVYKRRRRKAVWRKNANHIRPADDDLEQAITKSDAVMSEAGSSRFGRLLTAAVNGTSGLGVTYASEVTPPQSLSEDSDKDDFSGFEGGGVSVEPIIIPIDTDDYVDNMETELRHDVDNVENGIESLVALQVVSQETKLRREPNVVDVEEGLVVVDSNGDSASEAIVAELIEGCAVFMEPVVPPLVKEEGEEENAETDEEDSDGEPECDVNQESDLDEAMSSARITVNEHEGQVVVDKEPFPLVDDDVSLKDEEVVEDVETQQTAKEVAPLISLSDTDANNEKTDCNHQENDFVAEQDCDLTKIIDSVDTDAEIDQVETDIVDATTEDGESDVFEDVEVQLGAEDVSSLIQPPANDSNIEEAIEFNHDVANDSDLLAAKDDEPLLTKNDMEDDEASRESENVGCKPFMRWGEVSSNHSRAPSLSDDDQQEFKPDESWDFNDNDDDSTDIVDDPFQTPSTLPINDTKPLLRHVDTSGLNAHLASDDTVDSEPSSCVQDSENDTTSNDPFRTPSTATLNDEKPLLSRLFGTYKLDRITTSDSEKRRRSRSAPPLMKRRTTIEL